MSETSHSPRAPSRRVDCDDALPWLERNAPLKGCSVVTSLPDVSGLEGFSLDQWRAWFTTAATACLAATPDEGACIFYQTDIKREGRWVDKSLLCHRAAEAEGSALLWHKIVCRKAPGQVAFGRPGYGHLLCYSRSLLDDLSRSTTDVLPETGTMTWSRATGVAACELACRYVLAQTQTRTIVDPFCGRGTILAVANRMGLDAIGVEITRKRARKSRSLQL